jgi:hypothetical protein
VVNDDPRTSMAFCVWVSGEPASVAGSIARALELELKDSGGEVVLAPERAPASARAEAGRHLVEVVVGEVAAGTGEATGAEAAPDVTVPGDGARAGESARLVLRHLAAAGYADLDEYSEDDEAAVSGRLQSFGYL